MNAFNKVLDLAELPNGWNSVRLKDAATINKRTLTNKDKDYEFWYIDLSAVKKGYISFPPNKIALKDASPRAKRIVKRNDILMATVRPNLLGYAIVNIETKDVICSTGFAIISANESSSNQFIYHSLFSENIQTQIERLIVGSNYPAINATDVANLIIPLPPIEEQIKIAEILSTVDEKIEVIEQKITQTQELKKGLAQQLLTKGIGHTEYKESPLGEIPVSWELSQLNDIANITRLAGYEYSEYWEEDSDGDIMALRGYNIGKNKLLLRDIVTISNQLSMRLNRSRLNKGDVVFPCVGTIGNAAVIEENDKFHINQNIAKITPKENLNSYYLVQYLISDLCKKEIFRFNATTSQPNVLVGSLRQFRIPMPPNKEEQVKIAEILKSVDNKMDILESKKGEFLKIKNGLMQQLLTGKIRVPVHENA